jgi:hypothetical protein
MTHHSRARLRLVAPRVGPLRATGLPPRKALCAVGLKLPELVSAGSLLRVWGVFHFGP